MSVLGLLLVLFIVVIAGALLITRSRKVRHEREIAEVAERLGLDYQAKPDKDFIRAWRALGRAAHKNAKAEHVLFGFTSGVRPDLPLHEVACFSTQYLIYTGQAAVPVRHLIAAVRVDDWPDLHITKRTWLQRIVMPGRQRVGDPAIEAKWCVRSDDDAFAAALLKLPLRERLLARAPAYRRRLRTTWHCVGGWLCLVLRGNTAAPETAERALLEAIAFVNDTDPAADDHPPADAADEPTATDNA